MGSDTAAAAAAAAVSELFALFRDHGSCDYVGEAVSQEQHATQCAAAATAAGASDAHVAGALCHDVGHMLGLRHPDRYARMDDCGVMAHEGVGAAFLESLGLPRAATILVRRHVDAKRYLCFQDPVRGGSGGRVAVRAPDTHLLRARAQHALTPAGPLQSYESRLSPASRVTLGFQGGPMSADEAAAFVADPDHRVIIAMRAWDEAAKDPQATGIAPLDSYRALLERLIVAEAQVRAGAGRAAA